MAWRVTKDFLLLSKPSCLTFEGATDATAVQQRPSLLRSLPIMTSSMCVSSKMSVALQPLSVFVS